MSAMRSMPTDAGMLQLQQEALGRVRQMQQRARETVQNNDGFQTPSFMRRPSPTWGAPAEPPFAPEPAQPSPFVPPPQPSVPPPQESPPPQSGAQQPGAQQQQGGQNQTRPPGGQPRSPGRGAQGTENILSQLFGNGRSSGQRQGNNSPSQHQSESGPRVSLGGGAGGLLDLIRGGISGAGTPGLGDTLRGSISSASKPLSDLLDAFSIDGEKLLILLVMWVIFNERSDNKTLLLALGYLLL